MEHVLECYKKIISKTKKLTQPKKEKNIFSIGGKGHYENPVSDILSFFCDPREEHHFGNLFIRTIFDCLTDSGYLKECPELTTVSSPSREVYTDNGNRIDLIIEGESWVVIIENKIRSLADNPFNDYENYTRAKYQDKTLIYIFLAVSKSAIPSKWCWISYENFIKTIKKNIGEYILSAKNNKWFVFLRDFLLNLEEQIGEEDKMDTERIKFIKENYKEINELISMRDEYIRYIKERGISILHEEGLPKEQQPPKTKLESWGADRGFAVRFYSPQWNKDSIVVLLGSDGNVTIQFYVYDIPNEGVGRVRQHFRNNNYKEDWTEGKTIRCFRLEEISDIENAFEAFRNIVKKYNEFYLSQ